MERERERKKERVSDRIIVAFRPGSSETDIYLNENVLLIKLSKIRSAWILV